MNPVRQTGAIGPNVLLYDPLSFEIKYSAKTFVIDHPTRPDHLLVHACLEGPEAGVYYRGEAELVETEIRIELPDYLAALADNFTVQLTQIWRGPEDSFARLMAGKVTDNAFKVRSDIPCAFAWHVYGTRQPIQTEPRRDQVNVQGQGPYKYI